jgi:peroxiredoxin Q/BCP
MTLPKLSIIALAFASLLGTARLSSAVEVGDKAPDFKLPATTGVDISLSDFRGKKWVLMEFYGAAFVPT